MKRYVDQIEDAYVGSRRQGDMMRDRQIERTSAQDRRNRYGRFQYPDEYGPDYARSAGPTATGMNSR